MLPTDAPRETPAPPPGPLYIGHWTMRGKVHGWRPRGTRDWVILYTELGSCRIGHARGLFHAVPGDIVLIEPGTPHDYGQHSPQGRWQCFWAHWMPRPEFISLLAWPLVGPGVRRLALPPRFRKSVSGELRRADVALNGRRRHREAIAANALERAILLCDPANSRKGAPPWHPRIEAAVEYLAGHLGEAESLEQLARRFGFSRSRFAELFRSQVGQSPLRYAEARRLVRAREFLSFTRQTLEQIADHVGFSSPFHLSARFKKHFGESPKAFRTRLDARERRNSLTRPKRP